MRPVTHLPTCATETAGAGGLKIAETFPEGRGSPHGCGLRAVFCRDAASARPAACRDKSKGPRSGDFAGRSPGVQGAAATGRPLCAPCAIRNITQKINRERNLPGINIEVVALPNVVVLPNIVRTGTFPVVPLFRRVAAAPYPAYGVYRRSSLPRPGKRCAGGQSIGAIPAISPGGGYALPGQGFVRPVTHLPICATETAGAGGLKIAETFPEGRGSPHGCGLRAVFCRDAASARPAACRDKSKGPRSGDFAGRSPGVQGAAATGRPLCAPCAIRDRTQKINRERNLPGINIEVVALPNVVVLPNIVRTGTFPVVPLFRRVAAAPYPAYGVYRRSSLPRPGKRCAGGQSIGAIPAISPGGATPYPVRGSCGLSLIYPFARLKLPVLAASKSLRRSRKAGAARMDAG